MSRQRPRVTVPTRSRSKQDLTTPTLLDRHTTLPTRSRSKTTTILLERYTADLAEMNLARRRMGQTPEERLRWVVESFCRRDLGELRAQEKQALGYDLRALIPMGGQVIGRVGPLKDNAIERLHGEIGAGIRGLLARSSA